MITLITKTGTHDFNLKNYRRENDLCMTMAHLMDQQSQSSIKITTSYDEHLLIKIPDIVNFKFKEALYVKAEVHEPKPEPPKEENLVDRILKNQDRAKRKRVQKFLDVLKAKGVSINPDDPRLRDIIDKI